MNDEKEEDPLDKIHRMLKGVRGALFEVMAWMYAAGISKCGVLRTAAILSVDM